MKKTSIDMLKEEIQHDNSENKKDETEQNITDENEDSRKKQKRIN